MKKVDQRPVSLLALSVRAGAATASAGCAAGIGAGFYGSAREAFEGRKPVEIIEPEPNSIYDDLYAKWKDTLMNTITKTNELCQF